MIGPKSPLPIQQCFGSAEEYVDSLEYFITSSQILQTLCGGVHILDFLTRTPSLYQTILPRDWQHWFEKHEIDDILYFLTKADLEQFRALDCPEERGQNGPVWRGSSMPPKTLVNYVQEVRRHSLDTSFTSGFESRHLGPHIAKGLKNEQHRPRKHAMMAGMSPKKLHEVSHFAHFVSNLTVQIAQDDARESEPCSPAITHIVDFGSGQNYLGRVLASEPYCKDIIAVESRAHVVEGAKKMDARVNLVEKEVIFRNKKEFEEQGGWKTANNSTVIQSNEKSQYKDSSISCQKELKSTKINEQVTQGQFAHGNFRLGSVQHIQHRISDGDMSSVIQQIADNNNHTSLEGRTNGVQNAPISDISIPPASNKKSQSPSLMVISLHSCGNLIHHGLRTLTLNPAVRAVAMIGCCYNLMTERLGPPTWKIPALRSNFPRLMATSSQSDQHGFPMSQRFMQHEHKVASPCNYDRPQSCRPGLSNNIAAKEQETETGIRFNITARMMAVQAIRNWTPSTSQAFFTRHFYRAVLQRIFMDRGVVEPPESNTNMNGGRSPAGIGSASREGTAPLVIGRLSKACYTDFVSYVRGAVAKLARMADMAPSSELRLNEQRTDDQPALPTEPQDIEHRSGEVQAAARDRVDSMTDDDIVEYEQRYRNRRKDLCVIWSLMAFSAQVVEAAIVVDRWLWLKEKDCVDEAWVQTAFEYEKSPRNIVIVGIRKKADRHRD